MGRIIEERLDQFHRRAIQQACSAGLCAYVLAGNGRVMRFLPDGTRELIVIGATAGPHKQQRRGRVSKRPCAGDISFSDLIPDVTTGRPKARSPLPEIG